MHLQEQGLDICLLLCALWLEQQQIAYSVARLQQLQALAQPWQQDVVVPLRKLRQAWRAAAQKDQGLNDVREQLKQLELNAEREQLKRLAACAQGWNAPRTQEPAAWVTALAPQADNATLNLLRDAAKGLTA